jgi:sn-glycerol 3-phosphate transport system substrate-binding protein
MLESIQKKSSMEGEMKKTVAAFLVAACLSAGLYAQKAPIKISFWYSIGGSVKDTTEALIKEYNASQSKYQIEGVFAGSYENSIQKLLAATASGDAPVLVHQAHVYAPQLVDAGALLDLGKYISKDKNFQRDQFIEPLFDANVYKNKVYGIPFNCSTPIIYYNKDLFRKAGLDPNKFPQTWDGVYAAAKKISALGDGVSGLSIDYGSGWILEGLVWEFGAGWIAKDNSKVLWDDKAHIDAVSYFKKMVDSKAVIYKGGDTSFLSGKTAMFFYSCQGLANYIKRVNFDLGVAPFPKGTQQSVPLGGGSLYIFKNKPSAEQDGAWDFVKFLTSTKNQVRWAENTAYIAARKDSLKTLQQGLLSKDARYRVAYDQMSCFHPENESWYPQFLSLRTAYNNAWDAIMLQGVDPATMLKEAAAKGNQIIKDYQ